MALYMESTEVPVSRSIAELKPDYIALANERVKVTPPLFAGE